jgi:heptaprenyl diphosphate synthase
VKQFEQFQVKRQKAYEGLFSAQALCIAGLIIMPALLFNPLTLTRVALFFFFWFLAWLSGRKNKPALTIMLLLGIIALNLIIPRGEILYSIGAFRITRHALETGIHRAATLGSLMMLSRVTVRRDLKIPGLFGELLGESFRLFSVIMNRKQRITVKNLIGDIDRMMIELSYSVDEVPSRSDAALASRTKPAGFIILAVVMILSWLPWVFIK